MEIQNLEKATLGGGCFWCLDAIFREVSGIVSVTSGYSGGKVPGKPTYREVCSGLTGHAEVVQLAFEPVKISYREILEIFMVIHDPTTYNRQGADIGTQYRSVVFCHDDVQKDVAASVV
ncbi:MAG TPA: peptide-methionine (S)-S-oxide reductase MsrA, partial [Aquaticitalea sp.]|nr:peptide-methionine (S)-S-oxide reductase MsrA [Aquaticitalea sp.]